MHRSCSELSPFAKPSPQELSERRSHSPEFKPQVDNESISAPETIYVPAAMLGKQRSAVLISCGVVV